MRAALVVVLRALAAAADNATDCVAFCGRGEGGLSNTFAFLNMAYAYAHQSGRRFLVTALAPPDVAKHGFVETEFADVLGPPEWTCASRLSAPKARAPRGPFVRDVAWNRDRKYFQRGVDVAALEKGLEVTRSGFARAPPVAGCASVLQWRVADPRVTCGADQAALGKPFAHRRSIKNCTAARTKAPFWLSYDYAATRRFFRERYPRPPRRPLGAVRAVLHYRLGDVEAPAADGTSLHALKVEKRGALDAALADVAVLGALAARGWTVAARVASDSPGHAEVAALERALAAAVGAAAPPAPASARADFDDMATADLLVCGGSGFCHVAAMLNENVVLGDESALPRAHARYAGADNVVKRGAVAATADALAAKLAALRRADRKSVV